MYRLLLAQETNKDTSSSGAGGGGGGGGGDGGQSSGATAAAAQEAEAMKSRVHELERVSLCSSVLALSQQWVWLGYGGVGIRSGLLGVGLP